MKTRTQVTNDRRERLKAAGMCIDCGHEPAIVGPRGGTLRCGACRDRHRGTQLAADRKGGRPRVCKVCKGPATAGVNGGYTYCDACRPETIKPQPIALTPRKRRSTKPDAAPGATTPPEPERPFAHVPTLRERLLARNGHTGRRDQ